MEWSIRALVVLRMKWMFPVSVSTFLCVFTKGFFFPRPLKLILVPGRPGGAHNSLHHADAGRLVAGVSFSINLFIDIEGQYGAVGSLSWVFL
jgi:hypothetical protein